VSRHSTAARLLLLSSLSACSSDESASEPALDACRGGPATSAGFPVSLAHELDALLEQHLFDTRAPGVAAAVVLPGQGRWYGAAGLADAHEQRPVSTGDIFRIGSITKTFTAAAVLQLAAEGKLDLSDPVDQHVPGFDFSHEVTLERLLGHTAGIYNYTDDPSFLAASREPASPEQVIAFALEHGQVFDPGTRYGYSNTGYYLLGLVLERVEGKPYHQLIRERLLEPAGLLDTHLDGYEDDHCPLVTGHLIGASEGSFDFSMTWAWAAGALASPVEELCVWADALFRGAVLEDAWRDKMLTPSPQSESAGRAYGLGAHIAERGGRRVVGHTGSTMGFTATLFIDPETGTCVAVETNDFFGKYELIEGPIWSALP
jgi:D-alanyl-D-alanine carboxypeptidase